MNDPHFTIRIDQTEKIHRTVQRLRGQQEDLMEIQRKHRVGGVHPAQELRLGAFDEILKELERELGRLIINQAAEAASEKLVSGK